MFVCHHSFLCDRTCKDPTGHLLAAEKNAAQDAEDEKQDAYHDGGLEKGFVKTSPGALNGIGVTTEGPTDRRLPLLEQDDANQHQCGNNGDQIKSGIHV